MEGSRHYDRLGTIFFIRYKEDILKWKGVDKMTDQVIYPLSDTKKTS